jgi:hypothetical protein
MGIQGREGEGGAQEKNDGEGDDDKQSQDRQAEIGAEPVENMKASREWRGMSQQGFFNIYIYIYILGKVGATAHSARVADLLMYIASFLSIKEGMRGSKIVYISE